MRHLQHALAWVGLAVLAQSSYAQSAEEARLTNAGAVLQAFTSNPETAIPAALLQQAQGIAVVPGVLRMGLIFGGRRGRGVVTVRGADGAWTNPSFITVTGGSFGAQIGVESIDLVLVFGSARSVENIGRGKFTLAGDATATAGPVGRASQATTDLTFTSEVYAYTDNSGLFAGATLEGTRIAIDVDANTTFYPPGSSAQPLQLEGFATPAAARRFLATLDQTEALGTQPAQSSQSSETEEAIIYPLGGGGTN